MQFMGLDINLKNRPALESGFLPAYAFVSRYRQGAAKPYAFAWERLDGCISKFDTLIHGDEAHRELDLFYLAYMSEYAFFSWGGVKLYLCGDREISEALKAVYEDEKSPSNRVLTYGERVYKKPLEIAFLPYEQCPERLCSKPIGRHMDGCRIGFDAGASDRKVSAVIDGEVVYSEEVIWNPKLETDIDYLYREVVTAFKTAASKMPRVDAIGVSTTGNAENNLLLSMHLHPLVSQKDKDEKGPYVFLRAQKEIGEDIPMLVLNDGNVSALAGSMAIGKNKVWGVAIGTNIGTGYVDAEGNLSDMLIECATTKIALNEDAEPNEWTTLKGTAGSYFNQDRVADVAMKAGIEIDKSLYPAQKLLVVQEYMEKDDPRVRGIFDDLGCILAHHLPFISMFFDIENVVLLGRVVSGKGGEVLLAACERVLAEEYPETAARIKLWLPDENFRRVGQSIAAASLPMTKAAQAGAR